MGELRESINKVMTEISEIDSNSRAERDIEDVIQSAQTRRLTDLTDKLWDILKRNVFIINYTSKLRNTNYIYILVFYI